jgi:hypothetical protein
MSVEAMPFARAIDRLRNGLKRHRDFPDDDHLRDGLIQRFEFTYELGHRTLRRFWRETTASPDGIDQLSFADLIRAGNEQGLLLADQSGGGWARCARAAATPMTPKSPARSSRPSRSFWPKRPICAPNFCAARDDRAG